MEWNWKIYYCVTNNDRWVMPFITMLSFNNNNNHSDRRSSKKHRTKNVYDLELRVSNPKSTLFRFVLSSTSYSWSTIRMKHVERFSRVYFLAFAVDRTFFFGADEFSNSLSIAPNRHSSKCLENWIILLKSIEIIKNVKCLFRWHRNDSYRAGTTIQWFDIAMSYTRSFRCFFFAAFITNFLMCFFVWQYFDAFFFLFNELK